MNKSKESTLKYVHMYIQTHRRTFEHLNTDTHIHINAYLLFKSDNAFWHCLKVFKLFALFIELGKLFQIQGPI